MTKEEAIEYFLQHECVDDKQQSEAVWCAINSLEKQIPKKPYKDTQCPYCGATVNDYIAGGTYDHKYEISIKFHHCSSCGQAIDWSEDRV